MTEDEMVEWHHWLNGHEFEQTPGDSEEQGRLACRSPQSHRVRHDWTTKYVQNVYAKTHRTLETKGNLNECNAIYMNWNAQYCKDIHSFPFDL